jgi:hypothetical protein
VSLLSSLLAGLRHCDVPQGLGSDGQLHVRGPGRRLDPTAGRWFVDVSSGVTPKQFIRGEWFVSIAALTGLIWILVYWAGGNTWVAAGVAFHVGYAVRVAALWYAWEEPLAEEPTGVYQHSDGRPLLGRKLKGKWQRELRDLGLVVEDSEQPPNLAPGVAR